jgi:hypothetical protein
VSAEPYVVRRLGLAQVIPLVVFVGWLALLQVAGFDFPTGIIVVVAVYVVVSTALTLDRLRIDQKGVRMRPAGRIGWEHIDDVSARDTHTLAIRLTPGAPLPRGVRGMIDGELSLPARGFELDPARVDQAVRGYSEAGGSFSGRPGSGASSSGMSAGGPSG